jgi:hypothetical protein
MSESDPSGYRESSGTTDGPVSEPQQGDATDAGAPADEDATTLTTDEEAQHEDSILRPGNAPD